MKHSKENTIEYLKNNGFPAVFIDLFEGRETPDSFDIIFGVPEELYMCSESEQKGIIPERYQPLWDNGNFDAIYCSVQDSNEIVKVYIEGGEEHYKSYLHFAAHTINRVWEHEWDELIEDFTQALEIPDWLSVLSFIENNHEKIPYQEFEVALNDYVSEATSKNA
ncbi:hypothetical protein [Aliikangiella sp. IMCC44359]|uniref:hypothetical protein n=1 Tax=Aliikangiella sp. IMCC44359 TaxID=3459125 RepID=UPI00403A9F0B